MSKIKLNRREILGGIFAVGVGVPLLGLSPLLFNSTALTYLHERERKVLQSLIKTWSEGWHPSLSQEELSIKLVKGVDQVLEVVRKDLRADLLLALKLLSYAPSCFFLTGHLSPWDSPEDVKGIIHRWERANSGPEGTLFLAFSGLISAAFYADPINQKRIGYEGPPLVDRTQVEKF